MHVYKLLHSLFLKADVLKIWSETTRSNPHAGVKNDYFMRLKTTNECNLDLSKPLKYKQRISANMNQI